MIDINSPRPNRLGLIPSLLIYGLVISGCGESTPRIDATSRKSFDASVEAMKAGMTADEAREFDDTIKTYMRAIMPQSTAKVVDRAEKEPGAVSKEEIGQSIVLEMRRTLHGLTLPQVKLKARVVTAEWEESIELKGFKAAEAAANRHSVIPPRKP